MLSAFVLAVNDLATCARFWRQLLGVDVFYQDRSYIRLGQQGAQPALLLRRVPERHGTKNRAHLDFDATDLAAAAVSRTQELGGQQLRAVNEYGITWAVVADPTAAQVLSDPAPALTDSADVAAASRRRCYTTPCRGPFPQTEQSLHSPLYSACTVIVPSSWRKPGTLP